MVSGPCSDMLVGSAVIEAEAKDCVLAAGDFAIIKGRKYGGK